MTEYIKEKGLLQADEVDRLIAATPTAPLTQADFERLGFENWEEWLESICAPPGVASDETQLLLLMG